MKINHIMTLLIRAIDSGSYDWKKLDPKSDECKKLITQYWKWEVSSQSWGVHVVVHPTDALWVFSMPRWPTQGWHIVWLHSALCL